jgi:hypothetical protein
MNLNNQDWQGDVILRAAKNLRPRRTSRPAKRFFAARRMTDKAAGSSCFKNAYIRLRK